MGVRQICDFVKDTPDLLLYFQNLIKMKFRIDHICGPYDQHSGQTAVSSLLRRRGGKKQKSINNEELIEIYPEILNKIMSTPILSKK